MSDSCSSSAPIDLDRHATQETASQPSKYGDMKLPAVHASLQKFSLYETALVSPHRVLVVVAFAVIFCCCCLMKLLSFCRLSCCLVLLSMLMLMSMFLLLISHVDVVDVSC